MKKYLSINHTLLLYALSLLCFIELSYYLVWDASKQLSQQRSIHLYHTLQNELETQLSDNQISFEHLLTDHVDNNISYQVVIVTPSAHTFIHNYRREDQPKVTFVSLPYWQSEDTSDDHISLKSNYLLGYSMLEGGYQLYLQIYYPPYTLYWNRPLYWVPLLMALIFFAMATYYTLQRKKSWDKVTNYISQLPNQYSETFVPLRLNELNVGQEFLRLGNAINRISFQRHQYLEQIHHLSNRLHHLVDQSPLPMLLIRQDGQISFFNNRFEQVFMTSYQEDVTYYLTDFVTGSDKTTHQILTKLNELLIIRILMVTSLEDNTDYQLYLKPWFDSEGNVQGYSALLSDVSDFTNDLNTVTLKQQQQQDRLSDLDKLWSELGHELRTPLSGVIGTLNIIETEELSKEQQATFATLEQACHNMMNMLNNMLDVAKIEAGKMPLSIEQTDILLLCQQVTDLMLGNARQQNIELFFHADPQCPRYFPTDTGRLRQALLNLVSNAIKFTQSGHVALSLNCFHPESPQLQKMLTESNTHPQTNNTSYWLCFTIEDTGIGISKDEQQCLFSFFNQANDSISRKFGGTGLGLAFASNYAQLLGGFIHIESQLNIGSKFRLCLPCQQSEYQPIYQYQNHTNLTSLCLIAFINHPFYASTLRTLMDYLKISAMIHTQIDQETIYKINAYLPSQLTPVFLIEYDLHPQKDIDLLATLPFYHKASKILLSSTPERGISPSIRERYDSFLIKPLYASQLIAELTRLYDAMANSNTILSQTNETNTPDTCENLKHQHEGMLLNQSTTAILPITNSSTIDGSMDNSIDAADTQNHINILVVEDNFINQKVACKLLEKLGYQSVVADNGQQALDILAKKRKQIDLILMDCRMPYMDGLEATRNIREQQDDIIIVALTANDTPEDREACMQAGMNDFLSKPLKKEVLEETLQKYL
ncbi:response regulator [Psychrobacter sp. I-STPA6b]|uniref:response regulator n=1 Tax=Psychrobacter sp. I-STPA6b TaxID=2585718 RepID=UPI001D0CC35D|nr:response regulator [Psychrobacter sp. I-STPA6b]